MKTSEMARALGRRGGHVRRDRLSASDRVRIASMGGKARRQSIQATRRIVDNLRYVAAVESLAGRRRSVRRLKAFAGPLPGIYPARP